MLETDLFDCNTEGLLTLGEIQVVIPNPIFFFNYSIVSRPLICVGYKTLVPNLRLFLVVVTEL